jgi:phosphoribosylformimino-5-aminoimidazole carboxamide ribotide isomerase
MGFQRLIVLDLADVGVHQGPGTLALCRSLGWKQTALQLIAGGGIRHLGDLRSLAQSGCNAALIASALHDGRIAPDDLRHVSPTP